MSAAGTAAPSSRTSASIGVVGARGLQGVDLHGLGQAFAQLTGEPNLFPVPPAPAPFPADADQALASAGTPWVTHSHISANAHMASALKAWLATKGL